MPRIEALYQYPVASMGGFPVDKLTYTPECIVGNRVFTVVTADEYGKWLADPEHLVTKLAMTSAPELVLFGTTEVDGKLVLTHGEDSFQTDFTLAARTPTDSDILIPARVSRRSNNPRMALDCGDAVAAWISEKLGQNVRLLQAAAVPESQKQHFTWYTDIHVITLLSLAALSQEAKATVDQRTMRANVVLTETDAPFEEEGWTSLVIAGVSAAVAACERCAYLAIDPSTGDRRTYTDVLRAVSQRHDKNFGVYVQPSEKITLHIGQEIAVSNSKQERNLTNS